MTKRSRGPDDQQPDLGHVLHREPDALPSQPAVLDAAVRHVIHAPGWHVADEDATDLQRVPRAMGPVEVSREHSGLEAVDAVLAKAEDWIAIEFLLSKDLVNIDRRLDGRLKQTVKSYL